MQAKDKLYSVKSDITRVIVIGPAGAANAIAEAIERRGLRDQIAVMRTAGRLTPAILEDCSHADAVVIATARDQGFSAETRRECMLTWGLGLPMILAVEASPDGANTPNVGTVGAIFAAWAHRLAGAPSLACVALTPGADDVVDALLERKVAVAGIMPPLRVWIEQIETTGQTTKIAGRVAAGAPVTGQRVAVLPLGATATIAAVEPSATADDHERSVHVVLDVAIAAPASAAIVLADAQVRPELADQVAAHLVWTGNHAMLPGRPYRARNGGQTVPVQISTIKHRLDPAELAPLAARQLSEGEIGFCNLSFSTPLLFDTASHGGGLGLIEILETEDDRLVGFARPQFTLRRATNIHWQALSVDKRARASIKHQKPCCLWLTGLSGSGKSTIANLLEKRLNAKGHHTYTLDGDNVRHGLNRDLGFTQADRVENIRRVAEVARLFVDAGLIVITSFISPFRAERDMARSLLAPDEFVEIFVDTPLAVCEARDAKGLYRKARAGALKNFTGIDSPYETPNSPQITLKGDEGPTEQLVETVLRELALKGIV